MIKSYAVSTMEIDDGAEATREIAEKIAAIPLLKNTMGIVATHPEFVTSGVYAQVAKKLPFPVIGATTISHCANGKIETYMLSILILTSDDCGFSCALGDAAPEHGDSVELTRKCYGEARGGLPEDPKVAILYAPFFDNPRVGDYLATLAAIDKALPVFGPVANDDRATHDSLSGARTLYCGGVYKDRPALALICGQISPKFYIASVTEEAVIMPDIGVVTAASRNKLLEVNNVSAAKFFKDVGFLSGTLASRDRGMMSSIFVLRLTGEHGNGEVLSRIPVVVEDDGIVCGGQIVAGAVISVAFNTKESVLETTAQLVKSIKEGHSGGTAIIHSCIGRRYGLLNEPMCEMEAIRDLLGDGFGYMATYANGELCPIAVNENGARNQDHNQTLIACVF